MGNSRVEKVNPENLSWDEIHALFPTKGETLSRLKDNDELDIDHDDYSSQLHFRLDLPEGYRKRQPQTLQRIQARADDIIERDGDSVSEELFLKMDSALERARSRTISSALATFARWEQSS